MADAGSVEYAPARFYGLLAIWFADGVTPMLYDVPSFDVPSFVAAVALLLAVAFAAAVGPARRAANVDPIVALRSE